MPTGLGRLVPRRLRGAVRAEIERSVHSAVDQRLDGIDTSLHETQDRLQGLQIEALSDRQSVSGQLESVSRQLESVSSQLRESLVTVVHETTGLRGDVIWLRDRITESRDDAQRLLSSQFETRQIAGGLLDRISELRERLVSLRRFPAYASVFDDKEPLVTVRMATYNRAGLLVERSIPSVLAQSYQHFEVVVVGDACTDDTAERIARLGDPRIRFVNLPHHGIYPSDPAQRWMVAGAPAMNLGAEIARGRWIAPLDDDDEFTPDHIAVLLEAALQGRYEMVHSRFASTAPYHEPVLGRYPPELGQFNFVAGIYMAELRFFEYDTRAWMLGEPGDWNLCRRMMEAGVRIGWVDQVLAKVYPTGPRRDDEQT
jgi:hypothetical protein